MWTTQVWFPRLQRLLIDHSLVLPKHPWTLILLFRQEKAHPLQKTLTLLACKSSGTLTQQEAFCKKLPKSSCTLRKGVHRRSIPFTSRSGCSRALQSHSNTSFRFYDGSFLTRPGLQCYEDSQIFLISGITYFFRSSFGELPVMKRFLKGVFQQKPALARYTVTWDPSRLLNNLKTLTPVKESTLKLFT